MTNTCPLCGRPVWLVVDPIGGGEAQMHDEADDTQREAALAEWWTQHLDKSDEWLKTVYGPNWQIKKESCPRAIAEPFRAGYAAGLAAGRQQGLDESRANIEAERKVAQMAEARVAGFTSRDIEIDQLRGYLTLARNRIHDLEATIEHFNEILTSTGREREIAWNQVMMAMQQTFREAVILDRDMSEEQRAYWLSQPVEGEAASDAE